MGRERLWRFEPGETRDLAVSLDSELDDDASMSGETPTVTAHTKDGTTYTDVSDDFTFANEQVNGTALEVKTASGNVVETIAAGRAIQVRVTAPTTQGTYYLLLECDADDGTHVARKDTLIVEGPAVSG